VLCLRRTISNYVCPPPSSGPSGPQLKASSNSLRSLRGTDFEGAGGTAGAEVFRIHKSKNRSTMAACAPGDPAFTGKLYSKECYLVS